MRIARALAPLVVIGMVACSKGSVNPSTALSQGPTTHPSGSGIFSPSPVVGSSGSPTSTSTSTPKLSAPPIPSQSPGDTSMKGSSTTHVTGPNGINLTLDFPTMDPYSTYAGPKVQSSLVFSGPGGNALTLGGIIKQGTFRTSGTFALQLAVFGQPGGAWSMVSGDGSCHVTIATASRRGISGTYHCSNVIVRKGKPPVDLFGAFSSAPPVS